MPFGVQAPARDCSEFPNPDERDKSLHEKIFAKNMQIIFLRD